MYIVNRGLGLVGLEGGVVEWLIAYLFLLGFAFVLLVINIGNCSLIHFGVLANRLCSITICIRYKVRHVWGLKAFIVFSLLYSYFLFLLVLSFLYYFFSLFRHCCILLNGIHSICFVVLSLLWNVNILFIVCKCDLIVICRRGLS